MFKMKPLIKFLLTWIFTMNMANNVMAQTPSVKAVQQKKSATDTALTITEVDFPPLLVLIDSAIQHNAMASYRSWEIKAKEANVSTQKIYWLRNMGLQADTRYGTFDNFSSTANGQSTTLQSITNKQMNYGVGLYIKMPVFDVINRKTQVKQAMAEVEQAKSLQQAQRDEIEQIVIKQYEEVLLKQRLLSIKSQNLGSATVNYEMVEKEFRNGTIPIAEYVRLSDMTSRIKSEYEMAKSDFIVAKKILEQIVGFSFKNPVLSEK